MFSQITYKFFVFVGAFLFCSYAFGTIPDTWMPAGIMHYARGNHASALLQDGRVLVTGGCNRHNPDGSDLLLSATELYDPVNKVWKVTGSMNSIHSQHTATLLLTGPVLVTGGYDSSGSPLTKSELYDPASGTWVKTESMHAARKLHTATLLNGKLNGKVLVAGGTVDSSLSAELYDPPSGNWTIVSPMITARAGHTATLLKNGQVLVTGGRDNTGTVSLSSELYDPISNTWTKTGELNIQRNFHSAALLSNGQVLVVGGCNDSHSGVYCDVPLSSAELYNPDTGTWTLTAKPMSEARSGNMATLLSNNQVLVAGGSNGNIYHASAELYDSLSDIWIKGSSMGVGRGGTATLLSNGQVLVAGGFGNNHSVLDSAELYTYAPILTSFSKFGYKNDITKFSKTDFTNNFSGFTLAKIKIILLPTYGVLKLSDDIVTVNREIAVNDLNNLTYTPNAEYTGHDSFKWDGSDGNVYSFSPANVNIAISEKPWISTPGGIIAICGGVLGFVTAMHNVYQCKLDGKYCFNKPHFKKGDDYMSLGEEKKDKEKEQGVV